jgi:[protein-PII] uridylyltransferase
MSSPPATKHSRPSADSLRQEFFSSGIAAAVLAGRSALVDELVTQAWQDWLAPVARSGVALLAVGGYGRRELFPHSDVDLLLLSEGETRSSSIREALSLFLRSLWDQGLRLSHSVRTPAECCELHHQNVELNISLLDQRFLAGDETLYSRLIQNLPRFVQRERRGLTRHLSKLTRARHAKYHETIHHLEPNVKETPGGLRDFQFIRWLSRLGGGQAEGAAGLEAAHEFLARLRCFLHYQAGRDSNVLTFDAQDELAEQPFSGKRDPASWMRDYFRHARAVYLSAARSLEEAESEGSSLFARFSDWRSRLSNAEFTVARERVLFRSPHFMEQEPMLALRLFEFVARHGIRPSLDAERRIAAHLPLLTGFFSSSQPLWAVLEEILPLPHAALALRAMHDSGVLRAVFPEWAGIECLVVRDFYHRYTVDEHTLVSIQELTGLASTTDPLRRRFKQLYEEAERPGPLLFALLFHDTGKAARGGQHVSESVLLAETAMERIQAPNADRDLVRFLIDRHLDFSAVMNSRDPDEPATARFLAHRVGTIERLKYLTLATYADISAVHPTAMSPWRLEQLWRLYVVTHNELTRELDSERIGPGTAGAADMEEFLEGFPTRYLRTRGEADVGADLELYRRAKERGVALEVHRKNGIYSLTLVTRDRPFLLASITGALASFGLNILKAEAYGNRHGYVLDTFVFVDTHRTLELNPSEMDRFRLTLERVILGKTDVKTLLEKRPAPAPPSRRSRVKPTVFFNNEASATATLIEVVAEDRPGLLFDLTGAISSAGGNIEVVLIDTEAHKALDVFYVTAGGGKLAPAQESSLRESLLKVCQVPN